MTDSTDTLYQVRLLTHASTADALLDRLDEEELALVATIDEDSRAATLCYYAEDATTAEAARTRLAAILAATPESWPEPWELEPVTVLPREDWAESWKRHFQVERASRRLIVRPSWETAAPQPGDHVLTLDPGMSFGTGQHATTRACLRFIDELSAAYPGSGFLDLGCGSGILAIAAVRLGLTHVVAMDHDPVAVAIAQENAATNDVADRIAFATGDVADWQPPQPAPIVVANILAHVLRTHAGNIAACLPASGRAHLILAGILTSQYAETVAAFTPYGLRESRRSTRGEWTSGVLCR